MTGKSFGIAAETKTRFTVMLHAVLHSRRQKESISNFFHIPLPGQWKAIHSH